MSTIMKSHFSQENPVQRTKKPFSWFWSPWFGYLACVFLSGVLLFLERIDAYFPEAPIFAGTPFAMLTILIALIWGIRPALFSIMFGLFVIATFISSNIFTSDMFKNLALDGPFVLFQIIAIAVVIRLERSRRKLLTANHALTQSQKQLERANHLKDYIIMRASHELKTPLTTILGRTQLITTRLNKSGETPENWTAVQHYIAIVNARALHLRGLIDSLFNLSRVHAREVSLEESSFELGKLCHTIIENQQNLSNRLIELELPTHPILLQANEELFAQVLANLVSNAVNYSSENSPIQVNVCVDGSDVTLYVHNECPGLSPSQLEHLFEPFYRTPDVEYSSIPGWGLGLTICKEIVEQYGGRIWAESLEGKGVTLFVKLPCSVPS